MSDQTKYEVQELKGTMHKSPLKATESHPDMFGSCRVEGKIYKISAWKNESKAGNKYLSLQLQEEIKPTDTPEPSADTTEDIF